MLKEENFSSSIFEHLFYFLLLRLPETWQNPYQKCDLIGKYALTPSRDKCIALVCGHQTLQGFGVVREVSRKLGHFALEMACFIDSAR